MKELSIEQKAQRYDEALKKLRTMRDAWNNLETNYSPKDVVHDIEYYFPELKEPEDERVREALIHLVNSNKELSFGIDNYDGIKWGDILAWLEKQGEQKPSDKVEPEFKAEDWISGYYTNYKVLSVNNEGYVVEDVDGNIMNILFENEKFHHLWTIQDAKDGDVLAAHECYVIFKEIDGLNIKCYCTYHYMGFNPSFYVDTLQNKDAFYPATKEQRDTLMKAMDDAGYTFDFDKKELKKIEQTSAWSEEDEKIIKRIDSLLYSQCKIHGSEYQEIHNWLKSLRPQNRWKPSDEQIKVCKEVYADLLSAKGFGLGTVNSELNRMEEQLKKLREEQI